MTINPILAEAWKSGKGSGSTDQDYFIMYAVARAIQATRIVEIGTNRGFSTTVFCQAVIDNKQTPQIFTIDNWEINPQTFDMAKDLFAKTGFGKYIEIVIGKSQDVLPNLLNRIGKVDLMFIDGSHKPEDAITDFRNAKDYTDYILLHDTGEGKIKYLELIRKEGWTTISLPTRYIEGNNHLVGITLAKKIGAVV